MSDFFEQFIAATEKQRKDDQQLRFQEKVVAKILRHAGIAHSPAVAKRHAKQHYGDDTLGFQWLAAEYAQFPARLATAKVSYSMNTLFLEVMGSGFTKMPCWKVFHNVAAEEGWDLQNEHCGLVWNWPHADKSHLMVLHNHAGQSLSAVQQEALETRIIRPHGNPRVVYVLESLNSFLNAVGTEWL